ncbi:MAG: HAD family phosphatase [Bacilli bacterium]|nr:HAD family phosphatase [Bacilli bacterium]
MSKYKIIFVDIDDTLNPSNGTISEKTKAMMDKLKEHHIKVVVNTGRSAQYAINKSKEGNLSDYIISSNGSEVYNYKTKEVIYSRSIPTEKVKEVYEYCNNYKLTMIINSLDKRYINTNEYKYNNEPAEYFEDIDKLLSKIEVHQIVILSNNFDRMLVIPRIFKERFPELRIIHSSVGLIEDHRVKNKEYYHDIVLGNVTKSTGIVELLDHLKIKSEEAISIGNGYDDICMTEVVGTSIAVGNAVSPLKETSDYITKNVEEDGVAEILEKLVFD